MNYSTYIVINQVSSLTFKYKKTPLKSEVLYVYNVHSLREALTRNKHDHLIENYAHCCLLLQRVLGGSGR